MWTLAQRTSQVRTPARSQELSEGRAALRVQAALSPPPTFRPCHLPLQLDQTLSLPSMPLPSPGHPSYAGVPWWLAPESPRLH